MAITFGCSFRDGWCRCWERAFSCLVVTEGVGGSPVLSGAGFLIAGWGLWRSSALLQPVAQPGDFAVLLGLLSLLRFLLRFDGCVVGLALPGVLVPVRDRLK